MVASFECSKSVDGMIGELELLGEVKDGLLCVLYVVVECVGCGWLWVYDILGEVGGGCGIVCGLVGCETGEDFGAEGPVTDGFVV